jgi:hypothetical protein
VAWRGPINRSDFNVFFDCGQEPCLPINLAQNDSQDERHQLQPIQFIEAEPSKLKLIFLAFHGDTARG